jgi:hypothetical protein
MQDRVDLFKSLIPQYKYALAVTGKAIKGCALADYSTYSLKTD